MPWKIAIKTNKNTHALLIYFEAGSKFFHKSSESHVPWDE